MRPDYRRSENYRRPALDYRGGVGRRAGGGADVPLLASGAADGGGPGGGGAGVEDSSSAVAALPMSWLSLQQAANVPGNISFQLVCSILLPAAVASIVPAAQKGGRLGSAAMLGALAQLLQPVFGAMSDRMRTASLVCGRRRIFIVVAQLATVGTLAMMAWAPDSGGSVNRRFWLLAWGYVRC